MDDFDRRSLIAGASLIGVAALARSARAGDLNPPPGPIQSTGRSLKDIEPRTPVQSLQGTPDYMYVITQPGSYFLNGDIPVQPQRRGILVAAPSGSVSIDMEGFKIRGTPGALGGISVQSQGLDYLEISDGYVGDLDGDGIDGGPARCLECYDLHVSRCAQGIVVRNSGTVEACVIERCTSHGCAWLKSPGAACTFVCDDCDIRSCGGHGIAMLGDYAQGEASFCVCDCDCVSNTLDGIHFTYISSGSSSVACTGSVSDCRCVSNGGHGHRASSIGSAGTASRCSMQIADTCCTGNGLGGMRCFGLHADIMDCVCSDNNGIGLSIDTCNGSCECCVCCRNATDGLLLTACPRVSVSECACHSNSGRGLCADGSCVAVAMTECDCSGNGVGFSVQSPSCACLWNTANGNGANYDVSPACPIVVVSSAQLSSNTNPHANYAF